MRIHRRCFGGQNSSDSVPSRLRIAFFRPKASVARLRPPWRRSHSISFLHFFRSHPSNRPNRASPVSSSPSVGVSVLPDSVPVARDPWPFVLNTVRGPVANRREWASNGGDTRLVGSRFIRRKNAPSPVARTSSRCEFAGYFSTSGRHVADSMAFGSSAPSPGPLSGGRSREFSIRVFNSCAVFTIIRTIVG